MKKLDSIIKKSLRSFGTAGLALILSACPSTPNNTPHVELIRPSNNAIFETNHIPLEYRINNFGAEKCDTILNDRIVASDYDIQDNSGRTNNIEANNGTNTWKVNCEYDTNTITSPIRNFIVEMTCEQNPAIQLAEQQGLPQSLVNAVSPLGNDCIIKEHERNLITNLLPEILIRSNETITLTYTQRFIEDDNKFDEAESIVMSRFLTGRYDREGLLVHPGYFELVDQGHVQIPNAYFMSIFEMPFRFDPFPANDSGGKALPIVEDNPFTAYYNVFNLGRALEGGDYFYDGYSWFEAFKENISPSPNRCVKDGNYASMQIVFNNNNHSFPIDKLEIVNPLPVPAKITGIGYLTNEPGEILNASVSLEALGLPPSLGHEGLALGLSHIDDVDLDESGLQVGDIIYPEQRIGRLDPGFPNWRLIINYSSIHGFEHINRGRVIDIFHPNFYEPNRRGRVWPVYYQSVRENGVPNTELLGVHNKICNFNIGDNIYWGRDPLVEPMVLTYPPDTMTK